MSGLKTAMVRRRADAALQNEMLTRARVDRLESLLGRGFWGRLRWLFTGR